MVDQAPVKKLSKAQLDRLKDLSETNNNPSNEWYFPPRQARTCDGLVRLGLAWSHPTWRGGPCREGYAITDAGRLALLAAKRL